MIDHLSGTTKTLLGHLCLDTLFANLFLGALLGNPCLVTSFLETCSWKPALGNLSLETYSGEKTCLGKLFLETLLGNLFLEPLLGNLSLEPLLPFLGNLAWEPLLGNLAWEPALANLWESLGTSSWEPLGTWLGSLLLGTSSWEPLPRNLFLGTWLGNLAWEPLPGNLGTLAIRILAAPTCSETFTMAEDPKLLGKNS